MLGQFFNRRVHVKVGINRIEAHNPHTGQTHLVNALPAFSTTRLLVGSFEPFQQCLKAALCGVMPYGWFAPAPLVVIEALALNDGGLSDIEQRALREGALGAGARQAWVHQGPTLTAAQVLAYAPPQAR